jgi:acyl-lipid omega-6 desaturase (Delta-12 desaturase)
LRRFWTLAWAAIHFEYWWIALLLAVPAAGFLLRLFMIRMIAATARSFANERQTIGWAG